MTLQILDPSAVFIHIPKNAGTSIKHWMRDNFETCRLAGKHAPYMRLIRKGYTDLGFSFCVVRNPWDRCVSSYHYQKSKEMKRGMTEFPTFDAWMNQINSYGHYIFAPQHRKTAGVEYIMKYENLIDDFVHVQEKLKCYQPLNTINFSKHGKYTEYYTKNLIDMVYQNCKQDIKQFNYEYEG